MKRMGKIIFVILLTGLIFGGCSSQRKPLKSGEGEIRTLWVKKYDLAYCGDNKARGKIGIRYIKDSVLLVTMRNRSGMEGARIYLYRDSVFIYNRIKKTYYAESVPLSIYKSPKEEGKKNKEQGLLRKNDQQKYFEFDLGKGNRVAIYIKKYVGIGQGYYLPEEMNIKTRYEGKNYCYHLLNPEYQINTTFSVKKIGSGAKYQKVNRLDEVM